MNQIKDVLGKDDETKDQMTLKKKKETYEKCFRSQILDLPGPKATVKRDLP